MSAQADEDPAATLRRTARSLPRAVLGTLVCAARGARTAPQQPLYDPESAPRGLVRLARPCAVG
jgi:hypothetical protein